MDLESTLENDLEFLRALDSVEDTVQLFVDLGMGLGVFLFFS